MKGDFTRNTFDPKKHYSSVLMQQGRVQLDADWNEQGEIQDYRDRLTHIDVIGHCGGPMGKAPDGSDLAGFKLTGSGSSLLIHKGRYYVDGILCENEADVFLDAQPDLPGFFTGALAPGTYLAYLDVWERHITALEDPDIREVALGGPDTATRTKVVWQVKLQSPERGETITCESPGKNWPPAASTGKLAARAEPDPDSDDPCIVPPQAGYRRLENQLYRVEIHKAGGVNTATFKWSRENGSIVARWVSQDGNKLVVSTTGRDDMLRFSTGDWIELSDDTRELAGRPGLLVKVLTVEGLILTLDLTSVQNAENPADTTVDIDDFPLNPKVRRWESEAAEMVTVPGTNDGWLKLEDGVEVKFEAGGAYKTGDFWTIPGRANSGDVLWPKQGPSCDPVFSYAHGIAHHFCKLAVAVFDGKTWDIEDCRNLFPPLTDIDMETCCKASVGDGIRSIGKFTDIQEAVDSLGEEGGTVCILPGIYRLAAPVLIEGDNIRLDGCGKQALVFGAKGQPVFEVNASSRIAIEGLTIRASSQKGAIAINKSKAVEVRNCDVVNRRQKDSGLKEQDPRALKQDRRKRALKRPLTRKDTATGQLSDREGNWDAAGPAILGLDVSEAVFESNFLHGAGTVCGLFNETRITRNHATGGGIWIMDGSAHVAIETNRVFDGRGAGVILGGMIGDAASDRGAGVRWIDILDNRIFQMSGSGISTIAEAEEGFFGDVEDVTIAGNQILHCVEGAPDPVFNARAAGGIILENAAGIRITHNLILENGLNDQVPAVGVFLDTVFGASLHGNTIADNGIADTPERKFRADFETLDPGSQYENPYNISDSIRFTAYGRDGSPLPILTIGSSNMMNGLQCGTKNVFDLAKPVDRVILRMVTQVEGTATVTALDSNGEIVDEKTTEQPPGVVETILLQGDDIVQVIITSASLETLLGSVLFIDDPETFQGGVIGLFVLSEDLEASNEAGFSPGSPAFQATDNTILTPSGQALLLIGLGAMVVNDNTLTSRGPWFQPIREEKGDSTTVLAGKIGLQGGKCLSVLNIGQAVEVASLAAFVGKLNKRQDWDTQNATSGDEAGGSIPLSSGMGKAKFTDGRVSCNDNRLSYSDPDKEGDFSDVAFTIASFDDISMQDNQCVVLTGSFRLASTVAFGMFTRVTNNRFSEIPVRAFLSCVSFGFLANTVTGNQATHCLLVPKATLNNNIVDAHNLVLIPIFCQNNQKG